MGPLANIIDLNSLGLISMALEFLFFLEPVSLFRLSKMLKKPKPNVAPQDKTAKLEITNLRDRRNRISIADLE